MTSSHSSPSNFSLKRRSFDPSLEALLSEEAQLMRLRRGRPRIIGARFGLLHLGSQRRSLSGFRSGLGGQFARALAAELTAALLEQASTW